MKKRKRSQISITRKSIHWRMSHCLTSKRDKTFVENTDQTGSLDYCAEAMGNYAQSGRIAPTQYTTIYDLSTLTIRVHLFHDYGNYIEFDLKSEIAKGRSPNDDCGDVSGIG